MRNSSINNIIVVLALVIFSAAPLQAIEIAVAAGESIQKAIDSANDGDVILLAGGIFKESFSFKGKAITLRGSGRDTFLKGTKFRPAITFNSDEGHNSIVEKITFTKGVRAGAIIIDQAAPTIRKCWFYKNRSIGSGSAIYVFGTDTSNESAIITNNVFYKNKTRSIKPGNIAHTIYVQDSSPTINNNTFIANDRSGVYVKGLSAPLVTSNIFSYLGQVKAPERKKLSSTGEKEKRGRAVYIENLQSGSNVEISYNISFGNKIGDVYIQGTDFSFSELQEAPVSFVTTNGNLNVDPLISGISLKTKKPNRIKKLASVSLDSSSPAIDAGNPDAQFRDGNTSRNDIGATGGDTPFTFPVLEE